MKTSSVGFVLGFGLILSACGSQPSPLTTYTPYPTYTPQPPVVVTATSSPTAEFTATITLTPTISLTPTITFTPTITPTPTVTLPATSETACIPKTTLRQVAKVVSVIDGDTIRVDINGLIYSVRYIDMDTPEKDEPFYWEATAANSDLVRRKTVTLVKDVSETDQYGRLLRYVVAGSQFVNYQLVRDGMARASTYPPDVACSFELGEAERIARGQEKGLWEPTPTPRPQPTSPPSSEVCHPSYQGACLLVGRGDYDCGCGSGNGPNYVYVRVRVVGYDEFRLDRDGDGWGCECYP